MIIFCVGKKEGVRIYTKIFRVSDFWNFDKVSNSAQWIINDVGVVQTVDGYCNPRSLCRQSEDHFACIRQGRAISFIFLPNQRNIFCVWKMIWLQRRFCVKSLLPWLTQALCYRHSAQTLNNRVCVVVVSCSSSTNRNGHFMGRYDGRPYNNVGATLPNLSFIMTWFRRRHGYRPWQEALGHDSLTDSLSLVYTFTPSSIDVLQVHRLLGMIATADDTETEDMPYLILCMLKIMQHATVDDLRSVTQPYFTTASNANQNGKIKWVHHASRLCGHLSGIPDVFGRRWRLTCLHAYSIGNLPHKKICLNFFWWVETFVKAQPSVIIFNRWVPKYFSLEHFLF